MRARERGVVGRGSQSVVRLWSELSAVRLLGERSDGIWVNAAVRWRPSRVSDAHVQVAAAGLAVFLQSIPPPPSPPAGRLSAASPHRWASFSLSHSYFQPWDLDLCTFGQVHRSGSRDGGRLRTGPFAKGLFLRHAQTGSLIVRARLNSVVHSRPDTVNRERLLCISNTMAQMRARWDDELTRSLARLATPKKDT